MLSTFSQQVINDNIFINMTDKFNAAMYIFMLAIKNISVCICTEIDTQCAKYRAINLFSHYWNKIFKLADKSRRYFFRRSEYQNLFIPSNSTYTEWEIFCSRQLQQILVFFTNDSRLAKHSEPHFRSVLETNSISMQLSSDDSHNRTLWNALEKHSNQFRELKEIFPKEIVLERSEAKTHCQQWMQLHFKEKTLNI